jgi:hypothetical protein
MNLATGASNIYTGATNAGQTATTLHDAVTAELDKRRHQLSEAAHNDAKAMIDWFYGNRPGPPPTPTRSLVDTSSTALATSMHDTLVAQLKADM